MTASTWIRALLTTWRGRFIAAFVLFQLVAPVQYYLFRKDRHDERFAWRMFSPMRMVQCDPRFVVDRAAVTLGAEFHEAWVDVARRGRYGVLEKIGAALCNEHPGSTVELTMSCKYLDGSTEHVEDLDMCTVPEL